MKYELSCLICIPEHLFFFLLSVILCLAHSYFFINVHNLKFIFGMTINETHTKTKNQLRVVKFEWANSKEYYAWSSIYASNLIFNSCHRHRSALTKTIRDRQGKLPFYPEFKVKRTTEIQLKHFNTKTLSFVGIDYAQSVHRICHCLFVSLKPKWIDRLHFKLRYYF